MHISQGVVVERHFGVRERRGGCRGRLLHIHINGSQVVRLLHGLGRAKHGGSDRLRLVYGLFFCHASVSICCGSLCALHGHKSGKIVHSQVSVTISHRVKHFGSKFTEVQTNYWHAPNPPCDADITPKQTLAKHGLVRDLGDTYTSGAVQARLI